MNMLTKAQWFTVLAFFVSMNASAGWLGRTWPETLHDIETRFPNVPQISADELLETLHAEHVEIPVLLDIRTKEEYETSHLRGSILSPDSRAAMASIRGLRMDRSIVVYCSVGMRSSEVAVALRKAGYLRVANLQGGIFAWANSGKPVYRHSLPVMDVHPFNRDWGRLLERKRWAPLP
jgi:rhodanese-related sulfurtransferase